MSQPSLTELLKPRELRKASVQLLWPKSVKVLVRELADELGTSVNELVLRALQRSIAELSANDTSADAQKLIQNLLYALGQQPSTPRAQHDGQHDGHNSDKEEHAA